MYCSHILICLYPAHFFSSLVHEMSQKQNLFFMLMDNNFHFFSLLLLLLGVGFVCVCH